MARYVTVQRKMRTRSVFIVMFSLFKSRTVAVHVCLNLNWKKKEILPVCLRWICLQPQSELGKTNKPTDWNVPKYLFLFFLKQYNMYYKNVIISDFTAWSAVGVGTEGPTLIKYLLKCCAACAERLHNRFQGDVWAFATVSHESQCNQTQACF